ncbi:uncharacterized protein LOC128559902 isoform X2 [Mercenaria mercenaria]|uniref:uncharacterized protein LOC128559902 isoform X2 n=1 Tax=Mercenaria mercenaria TaxID=6596 RepID=UPI00234ED203|nr:uncharacterized protein LOC128559902 isoform X2 [Mercenaria mercenaria]
MDLAFMLVAIWLIAGTKFVASLSFTLSASRVKLGTTGTLRMTCNITEIDASVIYNIQIRRETDPGSNYTWETIAEIEAGSMEIPFLDKDIVNDKDFVAGGVIDKDTPINTYLTLDMNKEKLTYSDARDYRCELTYKSNITGSVASVKRNASLSIVDTMENPEYVSKTTLITVGVILGITNIVAIVYGSYMTVEMRKAKTRGSDNNIHNRPRQELLPPSVTYAKDDRQGCSIQETDDVSP